MRKLLLLLLGAAVFGVVGLSAATVHAGDDGRGQETAVCPGRTGSDDGADFGDRSVVARAADDDADTEPAASEDGHGTSGDDHVDGDADDNEIDGDDGDDEVCGHEGDDTIRGGAGDDELSGGPGDDVLEGQQGDDNEQGDDGDDFVSGGKGNDVLAGGAGRDRLSGQRGRDLIVARDGRRDRIRCGSGVDTVRADHRDIVAKDCEHVSRG